MYKMGEKMKVDIDNSKFGADFKNIYIYLTNDCTMHCKHCYLGKRLTSRETMPVDMVLNHLEFWRKLGSSKICFLGGEPTLYKDLRDCVDYAHKLGYEKVIINSNLINSSFNVINDFSKDDFTYVQVSLDGATEKTHDTIRGVGAYKQTVESIKKLSARGFDVRVIMTVNQINKGEVLDIIPLVEEMGASLVKFHIMSEIGNAKKEHKLGIDPAEWVEICRKVRKYSEKEGRKIKISYQPSYNLKSDPDPYIIDHYPGCVGKYKERISIFADGRCYICSFLFDYKSSYAVLKDNVIEINEKSIEHSFDDYGCNQCINPCGFDGCKAERMIYNDDFCGSNTDLYPVCRLWKIEI